MDSVYDEYAGLLNDSDISIINENLMSLDGSLSRLNEKRHAHLEEKMRLLTHSVSRNRLQEMIFANFGNEELYRIFEQIRTSAHTHPSAAGDVITQNEASFADDLYYCKKLCAYLWQDDMAPQHLFRLLNDAFVDRESVQSSLIRRGAEQKERFCYFRNLFADKACAVFSAGFPAVSVSYLSDFQGVCESVVSGQSTACILPLESTKNGFLHSFYRMIEKYGLKIVNSCDIIGSDGEETHRFVLLKTRFTDLSVPGVDRYLDISMTASDSVSVGQVLACAAQCGMALKRCDCTGYGICDSMTYHLTFSVNRTESAAFLIYLSLFVPQFNVLGVYPYQAQENLI